MVKKQRYSNHSLLFVLVVICHLVSPHPPTDPDLGKLFAILGKPWGNHWGNFFFILRHFASLCRSAYLFSNPFKTAYLPPFLRFPLFCTVELEGNEQEKRNPFV
jgi:hypothetical protein